VLANPARSGLFQHYEDFAAKSEAIQLHGKHFP
jgi:hypothetical protein